MKTKLNLSLLIFLSVFCLTAVKGQTGTPPSASGIKAAEDMLTASGAAGQFDKNISAIITQFSAQVPEANRAKFAEVMLQFLNKYSSWNIIKHDISVMYAHEFTESELKQLTVFYKTPLGIKLNEKQPVLMQAGMAIGQQAVMAHQDELHQMMQEAMK